MLCNERNLVFNFHFIQKAYWIYSGLKKLHSIGLLCFNYRKADFKNYVNVPLACCKPLRTTFGYPDSCEQRSGQLDDSAKGLMPITLQMIQQEPNVCVWLLTAEIGFLLRHIDKTELCL